LNKIRINNIKTVDKHINKLISKLLLSIILLASLVVSGQWLADTTLYHIVSEKQLASLTQNNVYTPLSVAEEDYIHFSKLSLILPIANDAYKNKEVLFLLQVTFSDSDEDLRWIGDNPHYYKGLHLSMVGKKFEFIRDKNNQWELPAM
jgi:uncharacterized protein (DUF952 family)